MLISLLSKSNRRFTFFLLNSNLAGRQHYASKRNNHLAKKDLLSSVTYLQNVVTYQVCILAAGANAAVDAIS